ncbi:hypothetical protein ACSVDE_08945 [Pseudalkalibacillus sp. Hm43]|uniref:hypothetical protein n=1 Tax=Pseudalkalibacillus sp. Hm43 TaxID=3450742 RepID=UPI003F4301CB
MFKTHIISLCTFLFVSGFLLLIGYAQNIEWLMLYYYEKTATSLHAGGSMLPLLIGLAASYLITTIYKRTTQQA